MATVCTGRQAAQRTEEDAQRLALWRTVLSMLRAEITYGRRPLAEALRNVATRIEAPLADLLQACAQVLSTGQAMTAAHALQITLRNMALPLRSCERTILLRLFASFGEATLADQQQHFTLALEHLRWEEEKQNLIVQRTVRLYRVMGWLGGLLLILILV